MASQLRSGYYDHLDFNSPMTSASADRIVSRLSSSGPSTIVDIGCGWAELLLRLLAACPDARGHGIDHDSLLIDRAAGNAEARSLSDRITFSAEFTEPSPADLTLSVGSEHVFGTTAQALSALVEWVNPGGRLLFGTLIWEQPPTAELLVEFGDLPTLAELTAEAVASDWRVTDLRTATLEEWDEFEFGFMADWEQVALTSAAGEEAEEARQTTDEYLPGYLARRGVLGFATLTLARPV